METKKIVVFNEDETIIEFINNFYYEHLIIGDVFNHFNPNLKKMLETINKTIKKDTDKINKTTSSIYLYEVENRILEATIFYLIDNNIITYEETNNEIIYNIIPEYDGIKIYNNEAINEEIINIIE